MDCVAKFRPKRLAVMMIVLLVVAVGLALGESLSDREAMYDFFSFKWAARGVQSGRLEAFGESHKRAAEHDVLRQCIPNQFDVLWDIVRRAERKYHRPQSSRMRHDGIPLSFVRFHHFIAENRTFVQFAQRHSAEGVVWFASTYCVRGERESIEWNPSGRVCELDIAQAAGVPKQSFIWNTPTSVGVIADNRVFVSFGQPAKRNASPRMVSPDDST